MSNEVKHFCPSEIFPFSLLPNEIQLEVFKFLPLQDLIKNRLVCQKSKQLIDQENFWQQLFKWKFPFSPECSSPTTWKNHYITFSIGITKKHQIVCEKTLEGHTDCVECITVQKGKIFSGSRDKTIKVWDLTTGNCLDTLAGHTSPIIALAVYDDRLVSLSSSIIKIWDLVSKACLHTLVCSSCITAVEIQQDKVRAQEEHTTNKNVYVWDIKTGLPLPSIITQPPLLASPKRAIQGDTTVFLDKENKINLYHKIKSIPFPHSAPNRSIALYGNIIVTGGMDNYLRIFNLSTKRIVHNKIGGHTGQVSCVKFEENTLVSASTDKTIKIWVFKHPCKMFTSWLKKS